MRSDFVLDAWEQARYDRETDGGKVHHGGRGVQYRSVRYSERLADTGMDPSVGSRGNSRDNAVAESVIGLSKAEVIRRRGQ